MEKSIFSTRRERRLWILVVVVVAGIYSTLAIAPRFAELLSDQQVAFVFIVVMALVVTMVLMQGLSQRRGRVEVGVIVGVLAVFTMVFLRIGLAERTHLIEYSVVAILIYEALTERLQDRRKVLVIALAAILASSLVGVIDESIQYVLPNRVFDVIDILFNTLASTMAVVGTVILGFARRRSLKLRES